MEMRATEEIAIGEDLTPSLRPLAAVLHDFALSSHCSVCFSALPPQPFPSLTPTFPETPGRVTTDAPTPLYCSLHCSSIDSDLHSSSTELQLLSLFPLSSHSLWPDSSDLRLSLRLVHIFQSRLQECKSMSQRSFLGGKEEYFLGGNEETEGPDNPIDNLERIAGLMTNRESLVFREMKKHQFECDESAEDVLLRIREGAKMMAKARLMRVGEDVNVEKREGFALEELVLCLVMTNAVEVQEINGSSLGIAVYDATFSWINHSCSPNSCYRFLVGQENDEQQPLRIAPALQGGHACRNGDGLSHQFSEINDYGPRVVVRSIKTISKGEEVTIAYTDLLQPKETRLAELWLKYQFTCSCKRCAAVPTTDVDYALQASIVDNNPKNPESSYNEVEKLMQNIDAAISDYLSCGDSTSCCRKLEHLLRHGDLSDKEAKSPQKVKLHPFHHLSLNAFIALTSAYKVQASEILALSSEIEQHILEAFNMYKTSSAYSFLLAGVANHLFMSEPAIVPTVATFWINAGESLLNLAKSSLWDAFLERELFQLELSSLLTLECDGCCLAKTLEPNSVWPDQKSQLYYCIANITPKVWSLLTSGSIFLKLIQNPVNFGWLESPVASEISDADLMKQSEVELCNDHYEVRRNLILLSVHCLRYGAFLSRICYGFSVETNFYRSLQVVMQEPD